LSTQFAAVLPFITASSDPEFDNFNGEADLRAEPAAESASKIAEQATNSSGLERSDRDATETETPPDSPYAPYRDRTVALLRRYFRMSIDIGRLPALLGREFFRSNVTSTQMHTFEDQVIFVIDIERCLDRLDRDSRQIIAVCVLQEYTQEEAAALLGYTDRWIRDWLIRALDELTSMFLRVGILEVLPSVETENSVSMPKNGAIPRKQVQ
jgi:DNA-directed RNA polymerase specialized sigma24 family protein